MFLLLFLLLVAGRFFGCVFWCVFCFGLFLLGVLIFKQKQLFGGLVVLDVFLVKVVLFFCVCVRVYACVFVV